MSVTEQLSGLRGRLEETEKTLRAILEGRKPFLDPNGSQGWLFKQMTRMHAGFFISEVPESYVMLPGEGDIERGMKGDMRLHPLAYKLVLRQKSMEQRLHREGIKNFKVLGVDYALRDTKRNPADQLAQAGALLLPRGDLYSLWQFTAILKERLDGGRPDVPLVLQNTAQGFWDPAIAGLGLDVLSVEAGKGLNAHLSPGPHDTLEILRRHCRNPGDDPQMEPALRIEPGSAILVVTRNSKKVHELQSILDTQKSNVRVLPFCNLFPKPMEAKETSRSYAGNNMEKVEKAWERLDEMGMDSVQEILEKRGIDPRKTYLWFDDRGLEFKEGMLKHTLFDECRSYLNPYKLMPGAEMAHVNKSMSLEDFYARTEKSISDMETQRRETGLPDNIDRTVYDRTNYIVTDLMPDVDGKRDFYSFTAATNDLLAEQPRPAQDVYKYSEHYQIPKNMPGGRTKAEIPDYIETMSSMALAAKAAMFTLGMEDHAARAQVRMRSEFQEAAARPGRWKIGTQHSLRKDTYGHGKASKGIINRLEGAYRFLEGNGGQYDPRIPQLHDVYNDKGEQIQVTSALNNFYRFAADANAFMLTSEERRSDCDRLFALRLFTFFSLVVGKQVFDPALAGSPFIVLNRDQERSWDDCLSIYTHLHRNGFLGDKPHHIFKLCHDRCSAENALQKMMKSYIPNNLPQSRFWGKGERAPDDLFKVTVYCSATSTNNRLRQDAREFAFDLARSGCAILNGGGMDGLMYETSMGVHDFRRWWENNGIGPMPRNHISSIQCEDTYQSEGLCDFNDYVCVHPNIFFRMDDLQDTDAEVFLPGGGGTMQEFAATLMLREAGLIPASKPIILVNKEIGHGRHQTRAFEALLGAMPRRYFEKFNIHVVKDEREVTPVIRKYQADGGKYVPPSPPSWGITPALFPR